MKKPTDQKPATVPFAAKQAGDIQTLFPFGELQAQWSWVEPSVWTDRMLTALEKGVEGGKWFSLIDKAFRARSGVDTRQRVLLRETIHLRFRE